MANIVLSPTIFHRGIMVVMIALRYVTGLITFHHEIDRSDVDEDDSLSKYKLSTLLSRFIIASLCLLDEILFTRPFFVSISHLSPFSNSIVLFCHSNWLRCTFCKVCLGPSVNIHLLTQSEKN